jgi:hypothetical protein
VNLWNPITVELMDGESVNRHGGGLAPHIAARVYDRIGRFQDTQNAFERPALDRLIATIDLRRLFDSDCWDVDEDVVIESWGVPCQLLVTTARP